MFGDNSYEFLVNFIPRRNNVECDLKFSRDGEVVDPLSDSGLGAADIASVALKVSYLAASSCRPILWIDEPCKNLSRKYHTLAAIMFRELSKKLGIQLVVVTHIPEFMDEADNTINVKMVKEVSRAA